jgi:hypothetical protein
MECLIKIGVIWLGIWLYSQYENSAGNSTVEKLAPGHVTADGTSIYNVMYSRGHNGIDHYLDHYVKKDGAIGKLEISTNGLSFISDQYRTTQKFKIQMV